MKLRQWLRRLGLGAWSGWPENAYKKAAYQQRLLTVQAHLSECLDIAPSGSLRIISLCAGDGRDVIGVLGSHKRRGDVAAWLVELNRQSVAAGVQHARSAGLENTVHFLNEDATAFVTYKDIAPAEIVLVCGVWGHVPADERMQLVRALASLCKPGGMVIWTRRVSRGMTRLQEIESLFSGPTWEKVRVSFTPDEQWAVATHRYCGQAHELPVSGRIFNFKRKSGR